MVSREGRNDITVPTPVAQWPFFQVTIPRANAGLIALKRALFAFNSKYLILLGSSIKNNSNFEICRILAFRGN